MSSYAGGDLYTKITQSASCAGAIIGSSAFLADFNLNAYTAPVMNGYATYKYASAGTYNAVLRVTDNTGFKSNDTVRITVSP
ncbi:hypothetical protein H0N95_02100 [Candidatus Micrarchaeota archaeon]|nr:hypothetical protein [Candidatus Micrarchaeota archaeon]